jgi:hypothetical protein
MVLRSGDKGKIFLVLLLNKTSVKQQNLKNEETMEAVQKKVYSVFIYAFIGGGLV